MIENYQAWISSFVIYILYFFGVFFPVMTGKIKGKETSENIYSVIVSYNFFKKLTEQIYFSPVMFVPKFFPVILFSGKNDRKKLQNKYDRRKIHFFSQFCEERWVIFSILFVFEFRKSIFSLFSLFSTNLEVTFRARALSQNFLNRR